jgi:ubiquinone/menaquinone biosynthesis C-methylase UbiE
MSHRHLSSRALLMAVGVLVAGASATFSGQAPAQSASERTATASELTQAEKDVPQLAEVLELSTGMTVADIGAGHGAMSIVMSRWLGPSGRLYATDISDSALKALRDAKTREQLENLVVVESGERATNLPDACCDGIFIRNVYHHITQPADFTRSLAASLRPGGRLAVLDFNPDKGSTLPNGVPKNRGGHGITPDVVEEELRAAGLVHVKTTAPWPATSKASFLVLFRRPA